MLRMKMGEGVTGWVAEHKAVVALPSNASADNRFKRFQALVAIKDGNISRRHAAVVFHNGAFYLKDLGSTNGVEYQGRRFDTKRIEEGDVFRICDYEIRFTYA
jgi:hypothetical protein